MRQHHHHRYRSAVSIGGGQFTRRRFPVDTRGFTLIEILISLGIFLIVLFAVYTTFDSSRTTYAAGEQKADIQQSARIAMEMLEHDLRLAGYGFPPGGGSAFETVTPTSITFRADLLNASTIISDFDVLSGSTTLRVEDASGILADDIIYLMNGADWDELTVQSVDTGVNPHMITTTIGANADYPWGTQVGRPLAVTYCSCDETDGSFGPPAWVCDANGTTLCKDEGDGAGLQPLADNIQTLQFAYFDANDVPTNNPDDARRIAITLTVQSPPGWWRPQVFTMESDVRPRNM